MRIGAALVAIDTPPDTHTEGTDTSGAGPTRAAVAGTDLAGIANNVSTHTTNIGGTANNAVTHTPHRPSVAHTQTPSTTSTHADEFEVSLEIFSGPFSLLLSLISKKKLDVTAVALSEVTDEFLAYVSAHRDELSQISEFLVIAATLLDLKVAKLLPSAVEEEELYELLDQRDLLFAKLLQYKAYKDVAADFARSIGANQAFGRDVPLEEIYTKRLPELVFTTTPEELAMLAVQAFSANPQEVSITHVHNPLVSVQEQKEVIVRELAAGECSFADLAAGQSVQAIVARFMAVLILLREHKIRVHQEEALARLTIRLVSDSELDVSRGDE